MAGFCVNCGTPLVGAFCNKCGAKAISPSAPVQASVPQVAAPVPPPPIVQPAPITPQSSGMGKILLWVGGILLVLFLTGVGATVYGYYWAKHKITSVVSHVTGGSSPTKVVNSGDSCRLLSSADLQRVLGVTIEKSAEIMQGSDPGCAYYTNPAGVTQLQRLAAEHASKQSAQASKRPGPKGDNPLALLKDANQMEGIVKSLSMTSPPPDGQIFTFTIERNFGPDSWSGMRIMESAVPGFEEVAGVGDRAMMGSFGHAFYILKGDVMIHLDTTLVPDARVRGAEIGKKITSHL